MANKNLALRLLITAKDEASGVLSSMQAKAAAVAAAITTYFAADMLGGAIKGAADFEAALSRVAAATGATGDELAQLKQAAEDAAAGSAFTQVEAAQGLENLSKAGLSAKEAIAALPGVMALAAAGDIELAQSAEIVTRTVAGMGIAVEETGRIADVLAKGANASNTSVKGLAEALSYTAPTARSVGLSLEQTVAILGKFADGGIDASRAGTALNAILSQFLDPGSKFRSELAAIGIATGDFDAALRQLAASGNTGSKAILAVGTEAGPALRSLLNQGVPALDKLKAQLDDAAGSAAVTAGTMGNNLNGAVGMLSGAWDALKIKLGEPVLPTLTSGVRDLAEALRGAVSDGTATKFGEALRSAFAGAIEWVRKFAAEIDPAALAAKLQETAAKAGAWFDDMAEKARNAGDIVRTAYGVMSAGANTVMAAVYKIAEAFAGVSRDVLGGVATIADGLAKVTFGGVSASFKAAADEIRIAAGGMGAVSKAYGEEAAKAFDAAASGAETARAGWAGLTKAATDAKPAVGEAGQAAEAAATQLKAAANGAAEAGQNLDVLAGKAAQSGTAQKAAAEDSAKAVAALRVEYDKLIAGGDVNGAVLKLEEIRKALGGLQTEAKATAAELQAAYSKLGITSTAELQEKEKEYRRYYDAIKTDGTATAEMLAQAFKAYAEKSIAASGGIATEAIKSEAALRGVRIEADEAGKSIVKIGPAAGQAGSQIRSAMDGASGDIRRVRTEADALQSRLQSLKNAGLGDNFGNQSTGNGNFEALRRAGITGQDMQRMGYSAREIEDYLVQNDKAAPGTVNRQVTSSSVNLMQAGADAGLSPEGIRKLIEVYPYYAAAGNTESKRRAAGDMGLTFGGDDYAAVTREYMDKAIAEARRLASAEASKPASQGGSDGSFWGGRRSVDINLTVNGHRGTVQVTDESQAEALLNLLEKAGLAAR